MTLITDASKDDKSTRPPIAAGSSDTMEVDSPGRKAGPGQLDAASVQTWASQAGHENSQWSTKTSVNSAQYRDPYAETVSEGEGDDSASVATLPTMDTLDHEVPATTPSGGNGATPSFLMATPETGAQGTSHSPQPLGASPSTPSDGLFKATHPMYVDLEANHRMTADPYTAQQAPLNDVTFDGVVTTGPGAAVGLNGVKVNGRVIFKDVNSSGPCCVGINSTEVIIASRIPVPDPSSLAAATNQPAAPWSIPSHMPSSSQYTGPLKGAQEFSRDPDGTLWLQVPQLVKIPASDSNSGPIVRWQAYDSEAQVPLSSFDQPVPLTWVPIYAAQTIAHDASATSQTDP